jgi:O-methyltransferase involved in polyketide biosynthesis
MRPENEVTTFSAMFTEMAYQWSRTRRGRKPAVEPIADDAAADANAAVAGQDEARVRAAMEAALERRRLQRTDSSRRNRRAA